MKTQRFIVRIGGGISQTYLRITLTLIICAICCAGCTKSQPKESDEALVEEAPKVAISKSLFFNRDSVLYYAERAYKTDDPKGCFVVGACYYLRHQDPEFPEEIYVVSQEEADTFLMISAAQNYKPAIDLIHCLHGNGCWHHEY